MGAAGLSAARMVSPMRAAAGLSAARMVSPMRAAAGLTATRMMGAPRGVDLDLATFDLSTPMRVETGSDLGSFENVAIGNTFWACIDENSNEVVDGAEKSLFKVIFDAHISD